MLSDNSDTSSKDGSSSEAEESHGAARLNYSSSDEKRQAVERPRKERVPMSKGKLRKLAEKRKLRKRAENQQVSDTDSERDDAADRPRFGKRVRQPVASQEAAGSDDEQDEILIKPTNIKIHSGPKRVFAKKVGAWAGSGFLGLGVAGGAVGASSMVATGIGATSIGAAGIGAKFGAVVGTVLFPGLGTAAGIAGGAVIGAGVGLVGGLLVGAVRGYLRSQKGHIDLAMQLFEHQGYELSQDEADRLQDPKIKPDTWANLLRVPGKGTLSKNLRVEDERDRELIRNAILMTVMKTNGNTRQRVREAFKVKQRLMRPLPWDSSRRGFEIVDHLTVSGLEPGRLDEPFDTDRLKCKLQNLANGQRARKAFNFLSRNELLNAADKRALLDCSEKILDDLLGFQPPPTVENDKDKEEDCANIAAIVLLCLAKDKESNGPDGKRNWNSSEYLAAGLITYLRKPQQLGALPGGAVDNRNATEPACAVFRENESRFDMRARTRLWRQFENGKAADIEVQIEEAFEHRNVSEACFLQLKAMPRPERRSETMRLWKYAYTVLEQVDREIIAKNPRITPEDRHEILSDAISQIAGWYHRGDLETVIRPYFGVSRSTREERQRKDLAARLSNGSLEPGPLEDLFQPERAKDRRLAAEVSNAVGAPNANANGFLAIALSVLHYKEPELWQLAKQWLTDSPPEQQYTSRLKQTVRDCAQSEDEGLRRLGGWLLLQFGVELKNLIVSEAGLSDSWANVAAEIALEQFEELRNQNNEPEPQNAEPIETDQ